MKSTHHPTLSDVAKLARVSVATASRAMSNPDLVAEGTRKAVREAAEACGYKVNLVARSLRTQRTNTILVLVPGIDNQFYPDIIRGLEAQSHSEGFSMILGLTAGKLDREHSYFELISNQRADGLVVLDDGVGNLVDSGVRVPASTVQVLESCCGTSISSVRVDDHQVAAQAVHHLAGLGHRRIAHISGRASSGVAQRRRQGFIETLRSLELTVHDDLIVNGEYSNVAGAAAMEQLLNHPQPPTAVFCANDASALGAMRTCRQRGLRVPGDLSFVGVDDITDAKFGDPPLTTVHQPRYDIGVKAMSIAINLVRGNRNIETDVVMPTELVIRGSTAAPRPELYFS